jgi:hypothetical protein
LPFHIQIKILATVFYFVILIKLPSISGDKKNPPGLRRVDFFATTLESQRYLDCCAAALPGEAEIGRKTGRFTVRHPAGI